MEMRDRLLDEFRHVIRTYGPGKLPRRPRPEELWETLDCDATAALILTLEYLAARREALSEARIYETPVEAAECTLGRGVAA